MSTLMIYDYDSVYENISTIKWRAAKLQPLHSGSSGIEEIVERYVTGADEIVDMYYSDTVYAYKEDIPEWKKLEKKAEQEREKAKGEYDDDDDDAPWKIKYDYELPRTVNRLLFGATVYWSRLTPDMVDVIYKSTRKEEKDRDDDYWQE